MKGEIEIIGPIAEALGVSLEAVRDMSLRELSDRAFDLGFEWKVDAKRSEAGQTGKLRLICDTPSLAD